jgi:hypothetical protein
VPYQGTIYIGYGRVWLPELARMALEDQLTGRCIESSPVEALIACCFLVKCHFICDTKLTFLQMLTERLSSQTERQLGDLVTIST